MRITREMHEAAMKAQYERAFAEGRKEGWLAAINAHQGQLLEAKIKLINAVGQTLNTQCQLINGLANTFDNGPR